MIQTILIGLVSLGAIIFIHELGHFIAAKGFGIEVEAFALGWGRKLLSFTRGATEYRINIFPMGGYCRMKGEEEFREALAAKSDSFAGSPGSLFSVSPLKRLITYAAGPIFNFLLAGLLLSFIWWIGYTYVTYEPRIILTSQYSEVYEVTEDLSPAERAGLESGDVIRTLDGKTITTFSDLQQIIISNPQKEMDITYERDGILFSRTIRPGLNRSSGAGYVGIAPYVHPVVSRIQPDSSAELAGLRQGDVIKSVDGVSVAHQMDFYAYLISRTPGSAELTVQRDGRELTLSYVPSYNDQGHYVSGFAFQALEIQTPGYSFLGSLGPGFAEAVETFFLTIRSIGVLFRGVDTAEAVAGPIRITYLVGDATTQGFQAGVREGFITLFRLIAFISIALSFANLLPIPALDGGQIVLSVYEIIRGRMISPRKYYILQLIGFSIIMSIFFFALLSDITFFTRR